MKYRTIVLLPLVGVVAGLLAACGQAPGELGQNQKLAKSCPKDKTLAAYVATDESGTGRDETVHATRTSVIESIVRQVAVCGGHLRVVAFSSSAAASVIAFDQDLKPEGATEIAKLRKVPGMTKATTASIMKNLDDAIKKLPSDGSDITAQFGLANEYINQMNASGNANGATYQLSTNILTDGIQTVGIVLNTDTLTPAIATNLASKITVPNFPTGTAVKISGIGKVAGPPPPTDYINAVKAFYSEYCKRTGATCQVVTDYSNGS